LLIDIVFLSKIRYDRNTMQTPEGTRSREEWKNMLTPEQYHVMFEQGTEAPFTGQYVDTHEQGVYRCAACHASLFDSDAKFDSGTGWPSFDQPANRENVVLMNDESHGASRTEVRCKNCGAHLGHVFNDGPTDTTGKRFCINSCSLTLDPLAKQ